mgnify:CR=1 FL=1
MCIRLEEPFMQMLEGGGGEASNGHKSPPPPPPPPRMIAKEEENLKTSSLFLAILRTTITLVELRSLLKCL